MPMPPPLTPDIALAHERLYPRVTALLKQVERLAVRHPEQPVPPAVLGVARGVFKEGRRILGREVGQWAGRTLLSLGGLSVGLGQLVAGLEAFEAEHASFSYDLRCVAWNVKDAQMPVSRLKPAGLVKGFPPVNPQKREDTEKLRHKIGRRIDEIASARYMTGYRDGKAGRPPLPPFKDGDATRYPQEDQPTYPRG